MSWYGRISDMLEPELCQAMVQITREKSSAKLRLKVQDIVTVGRALCNLHIAPSTAHA